ncbi:hypothetical protein GCM10009861_18740 [Neomicrococcus aestuarii]
MLPDSNSTSPKGEDTRAHPEIVNTTFTESTTTGPESTYAVCSRTASGIMPGSGMIPSETIVIDPRFGEDDLQLIGRLMDLPVGSTAHRA